ncbi:fucosyltransferase CAZy family GT37-like protein [Selaginella moellendorffii]|uniref:Fucosyltransferase n=2 Tax=Selaginella moellendorffii TaxID=88036 RepID=D8RE99_SELML|nr:fucosyltransferase CAZy family GT37-like protein [Selaginella moellendorffii]
MASRALLSSVITAMLFVMIFSRRSTRLPSFQHMSPNAICVSRSHHSYMMKPSRVLSVPPALSSALAEYEKMHSKCYHSLKQSITNPEAGGSCKYLVHYELDGLGNRLLGLVSTFVFSLLTNRVLLIDPKGQSAKLLCEPFANSSWLVPQEFPRFHLDQAQSLEKAVQSKKFGSMVHVWVASLHRDQDFFHHQVRSKLKNVTWISLTSNLYFVPRLFTFPEFWKPLMSLFPDVRMAFTHLTRYLLLPQDHVWEKIVRFDSTYLSGPGKQLGIQIRLHHRDDPGEFDQRSFDRILECLIGKDFLPMMMNSTTEIISAHPPKRIKVFVASLQGRYFQELKQMYLKYPSLDGSLVQIYTFSQEGVQNESIQQATNALAEMWLLGFSDVLVTSSSSTFGYIAQGIAGVRPYVLHIRPEDLKNCSLPACSRRLSPAPCNHQPYFEEEENLERSTEHLEWMNVHIRRCQDNWHGVQIV